MVLDTRDVALRVTMWRDFSYYNEIGGTIEWLHEVYVDIFDWLSIFGTFAISMFKEECMFYWWMNNNTNHCLFHTLIPQKDYKSRQVFNIITIGRTTKGTQVYHQRSNKNQDIPQIIELKTYLKS